MRKERDKMVLIYSIIIMKIEDNDEELIMEMDEMDEIVNQRGKQITTLVKTMKELQNLFQQLNEIVIE